MPQSLAGLVVNAARAAFSGKPRAIAFIRLVRNSLGSHPLVVKDKDFVFEENNEGMLGAKSQERSWSSDICSQSSSLGSFDGVGKTRGKT